jgi:diguanylate cyclase (GGDEF)-like protein/PAS domain S-box-containing protein
VEGAARWAPWAILAVLAAVALATALLLGHVLATRRALAHSEARHKAVLRSMPDAAVVSFDRQLRYVAAEGPALEAIGWQASELIGRTPFEVLPADRAERIAALYRAATDGELSRVTLTSHRGARDFDVEFAPVYGADGDIEGGMAVARDITDRVRAERQIEEAEERFRLAFEQAPIGIAMVSLDGSLLRVNDALCRMLGFTGTELLGTTFTDVTHPEDVGTDRDEVRRCLDGEIERFDTEKRLLTSAGEVLVAAVSVSLVRDRDARPLYFLSQAMDVTERRQAEERLAYLAAHDVLTGLLNRRRFDEEVARQLATTTRHERPGSVLMLDLDRFKLVNDRFGHAAGDELIARVGRAMQGRLRPSDVVARLGGDEFGVLLPETAAADAELVARDLGELIARLGVVSVGDHTIEVTASIGVAEIGRAHRAAEDVLLDADAALYAAKHAGRATVALHTPASV